MNLRSSLFAAALALATFAASPAHAHDPNEEFDSLPPPPAMQAAPATCAELAKRDASGKVEGDDAKALRQRCAVENKAKGKASAAPASKT